MYVVCVHVRVCVCVSTHMLYGGLAHAGVYLGELDRVLDALYVDAAQRRLHSLLLHKESAFYWPCCGCMLCVCVCMQPALAGTHHLGDVLRLLEVTEVALQ